MNTEYLATIAKKLKTVVEPLMSIAFGIRMSCHTIDCPAVAEEMPNCPQTCVCGGNNLDFVTGIFWQLGSDVLDIASMAEDIGHMLERALKLNNAQYFDEFDRELRYAKEHTYGLLMQARLVHQAAAYHQEKYPVEHEVSMVIYETVIALTREYRAIEVNM